jgi:serine/threonine-protein kinase RsbW
VTVPPTMSHAFSVRLANRLSEIAALVDRVESFGREAGLSSDLTFRVALALDEIVSNVIKYGYSDDGNHVIDVRVRVKGGVVTAVIEDEGRPFDPRTAPMPDLDVPIQQRRAGGLGLFLVKAMMDSIDLQRQDGRNILTVTASPRPGDQ